MLLLVNVFLEASTATEMTNILPVKNSVLTKRITHGATLLKQNALEHLVHAESIIGQNMGSLEMPCKFDSDCLSAYWCNGGGGYLGFSGTCAPKHVTPAGAQCTDDRQCESNRCSCNSACCPLPNGEMCAKDADCQSGHCNGNFFPLCNGTCSERAAK